MNHNVVRTLKRIAILSVAGAIAMSASTMTSPSAFAASPSANNSGQVPLDQQKQKNKQGSQSQGQQNGQQNGQAMKNQPGGQAPRTQQQVQQQKNQNGGQSQIQKNAQALKNQPAGQPPKTMEKVQQLNNQNGMQPQYQNGQQQTQQQKNQKNGQQFGQGQSNQPPKNNQNGQANNNNSTRQRYDWTSYRPGHQPPQWQQYHKDFNPHPYQWNRTSNQRYHYQSYQRPHGWYAQRWTYGQTLPALFWVQAYWLTGYYNFGLIDPPYGYVWVQNGNDALLVNVQNGQILSVEYNVFYS